MSLAALDARLRQAAALMAQRRFAEARVLLEQLVLAEPRLAEARRLLGGALHALGDVAGAERELRQAVALARRSPAPHTALAELLAGAGRGAEAEKAWRAALAADRRFVPAVIGLARWLNDQGRAADAVKVTTPVAVARDAHPEVLAQHGRALSALGRLEEALAARRRAAAALPNDPVAEHNVAAVLGDLRRHAEAAESARRALAKGGQAPETWLVLARACAGQDLYDDAEAAYRAALARRPVYIDALRELSRLIWMRAGEVAPALAPLEAAQARAPANLDVRLLKAQLLDYAGEPERGLRELEGLPPDAGVALTASQLALRFDSARALVFAREAARLAPRDGLVRQVLAKACLAAGQWDEALAAAEARLADDPADQFGLALKATALRLKGDPEADRLYDYDTMVRAWTIDTPPGWPSLEAYLADLAEALRRLHRLKTHPIGQSLRHGTQTHADLKTSDEPAIRAFFTAIDGPIRRHMQALGMGRDPLRRRNTGRYRIAGAWSVRLRPGGYHEDHIHPEGWLSSACYVEVPPAVGEGGREGWIRFGQSGVPTDPLLPPGRWEKPEPGKLVLFPSYMWHGTEPFGGDASRLTLAFDVAPA